MHISRMSRKNPELGFSLLSFESQSPRLPTKDLSQLLQLIQLIFNPRYRSVIDFHVPFIRQYIQYILFSIQVSTTLHKILLGELFPLGINHQACFLKSLHLTFITTNMRSDLCMVHNILLKRISWKLYKNCVGKKI